MDAVTSNTRARARDLTAEQGHLEQSGNLHDLRHSRLTHAGEDGLTEADLMNLSGHEDRRTQQRYLAPGKERTHERLDGVDACRGTTIPSADELTARMNSSARRGPGRGAR